ncbi:MAG TPA: AAA family ATPase [Ktedonobacteraceae bacterium]
MLSEDGSQCTGSRVKVGSMRRIVVVGTSGSGKTTLARQLGRALGIPAVELDALHWEPNWQTAEAAVLRERVAEALSGEAWVVDGNYNKLRDLTWGRADTVIWLDYNLRVVMSRVIMRTFRRAFSGEELWNGNRERLENALLSKNSIILWALQTHRKNRLRYEQLANQPEYAHLTIVRHRSPRATSVWLAEVSQK